ncbi:hypothetical protein [Novosphingobium sp. Rr 2-17]|uniref:hypothetical protein n=1 Tax=Novosphingobium sp. Rr 2-17 TaxID=555793 RepID=UPI0012F67391|nr:hypothetical protein [Novosphingobium sp. Rr 2-17]
MVKARLIDGINKSAYFALRLFRTLQASKAFPENSIALAPVTIDYPDRQDAGNQVPAVLIIRFVAFRNNEIDVTRDDGGSYTLAYQNSFADWIAPRFAMATEAMAWPGSGGLIATIGLNSAPSFSCPAEQCLARAPQVRDLLRDQLGYVMGNKRPGGLASIRDQLPFPNEVADAAAVFTCADTPDNIGTACPHEQLILAYARQALRQTDPYLATRYQWKRYIARYDPKLAERWPGGIDIPAAKERLIRIKKIMATERRFIAIQSLVTVQAALEGAPGQALRAQRQAERDYSASVRKSRSSFGFASILSAATTMTQFSQAFAAKNTAGQMSAIQSEMDRSQQEASIAKEAAVKVEALFSTSILQPLTATGAAQNVLGREVSAETLAQLQQRLRQIYAVQALPALPANAECARSTHDGINLVAYGSCRMVPVGTREDVVGTGHGHNVGDAIEVSIEFSGKLQILVGNWSMVDGKLAKLSLNQAALRSSIHKDYTGKTVGCFVLLDDQKPTDEMYMNRCAGRADIFSNFKDFTKPMAKGDSALLDARIAEWRKQTHALIAQEPGA